MRKAVLWAPLGPPPSSGHTLMIDPGRAGSLAGFDVIIGLGLPRDQAAQAKN